MTYTFKFLDKTKSEEYLPALFDILYRNMMKTMPVGGTYDENKQFWTSCIAPEIMAEDRQVILMYADDELAGYFKYSLSAEGDELAAEDLQIWERYQKTKLFGEFFRFMKTVIPPDTEYIKAYTGIQKSNSLSIMEKLGMEIVGTNKNGVSLCLRGKCAPLFDRLQNKGERKAADK